LEIVHWKKSQWLQEPNVTEAGCEREVTRETVAALMHVDGRDISP
jgi:hypothetical protein